MDDHDYEYTYIDVGARDITFPFWTGDISHLDCIAFEPDLKEYTKLQEAKKETQFKQISFINAAVGLNREATLFITQQPGCSSIYEPLAEYAEIFNRPQNFLTIDTQTVHLQRLDELVAVPSSPILIKLDIEGAEMEAITSMGDLVSNVWLAQVEVNFIPYRKNQTKVSDILNYFEENGFWLVAEKDAGEYRFDGQSKYQPFNQNEKAQDYHLPFSQGIKCSSDLVFLKKPEHIDQRRLKHYVHLLYKIQQFDLLS